MIDDDLELDYDPFPASRHPYSGTPCPRCGEPRLLAEMYAYGDGRCETCFSVPLGPGSREPRHRVERDQSQPIHRGRPS